MDGKELLKLIKGGTTQEQPDKSNDILDLIKSGTTGSNDNKTEAQKAIENVAAYKKYYQQQDFTQPKPPNKFVNFLGALGTTLNTFPRMGASGALYNIEKAKQSIKPTFGATLKEYAFNRPDYWKTWSDTLRNQGKYKDTYWKDVYNLSPALQKPIAESIPAIGQALQKGTEKHPDKFTKYTNQFLSSLTPAAVLGFITDVVADPLTWLGMGGSASMGKGLVSVGKAAKLPQLFAKIKEVPKLGQAIKALQQTFSPIAESGLNKELYLAKRLTEKEAKHNTAKFITKELNPMLKGLNVADREIVKKAAMAEFDKAYYIGKLQDAMGQLLTGKTGGKITDELDVLSGKVVDLTKVADDIPDALKPIKQQISNILETAGKKEMQTGQIPKMLEEYFPGIYKDKSLKDIFRGQVKAVGSDKYKYAQEKVFKTFEQAEKAGKTVDSLENVLAKRMKAHFDRMGRYDFLEQSKKFAIKTDDLTDFSAGSQKYVRQGMQEVTGIDQLKGYKFEPEIAEALGKLNKFTEDTNLQAFTKMFIDHPLGIWKLSATAVNPGFHVRNFMSNYWLLFLKDGAEAFNPFRNMLNIDILTAAKTGRLDKTVKFGNKVMTYGEVLDTAGKRGVLGGFFGEELLKPGGKGFTKPLDALRKVSGGVEDQARMLGFINDMFKTGGDDITSAQRVWKYLFDYGELTSREQKYFKRIAPFYTWMRKNISLQIEQLFEQPGKFAGIQKFKTALESLSEDKAPDETYLPEYFEKLYAMRTPVKDDDGNYIYLNPNLAFQDINKINDFVDMYSTLNPMLRMPIEMAFNYNTYYKQPIQPQDWGFDQTLTQAPFPGFVADQVEKLPEGLLEKLAMYKTDEGLKMRKLPEYAFKSIPFLYSMAKSFPQEEAKTPNTFWRMLSWLGGVKFLPYGEEKQKEYYYKDYLKNYQMDTGKLKVQGKVPKDMSLTDIKKATNTTTSKSNKNKTYEDILDELTKK